MDQTMMMSDWENGIQCIINRNPRCTKARVDQSSLIVRRNGLSGHFLSEFKNFFS